MNAACQSFRDSLIDQVDRDSSSHARECAECAAFEQRFVRAERVLASLERVVPPNDLEGRVRGALEAGGREQRAVRAVAELARVGVPEQLDRAVERAASSLSAPDVLRRLVEEELADPSKAVARRFVGSLPRESAPAELALRVADRLRVPARSPRVRSRWWFAGSAAAALVLGVSIVVALRGAARAQRNVEWVSARDASELSPMARSLFAGFSGGSSECTDRGGVR